MPTEVVEQRPLGGAPVTVAELMMVVGRRTSSDMSLLLYRVTRDGPSSAGRCSPDRSSFVNNLSKNHSWSPDQFLSGHLPELVRMPVFGGW
jgi:hypothetical protein